MKWLLSGNGSFTMNELFLLHLSDLHSDAVHRHNLSVVKDALFKDLKTLREDEKIIPNCVIFSGDLLFNGNDGYSCLPGKLRDRIIY
jgi:hypothetical protein